MRVSLRGLCGAACGVALICGCSKDDAKQVKEAPKPRAQTPIVNEVPPSTDVPDAILVTVNGTSFTRRMAVDMAKEMALRQGMPAQYAEQYVAQGGDALLRQSADQFISQTLVKAEIERRAEPVAEKEIEAVIERISLGLPPDMTLTNALAAQGMTLEKLRDEIVMNERTRKLIEAEAPAVSNAVSDADVAAFYKENESRFTSEESVEARHILLACPSDASAETRAAAMASAESVRTQLVAGADFAQLAAATSSCPSKAKGGSLGPIRRGQMVPAFEKATFSQALDAIGPVVETEYGYHVIQVTKKQPAGVTPLEEVSDKIRSFLVSQAREKRFNEYLKALRAKAVIVYAETGTGAGEESSVVAPNAPN